MFLRFNKRIWIPAAVLTVFWLFWPIIAPIFPVILQMGTMVLTQALMIVVWIGLFFGLMASRVRINKYKPGDLDYTWDDYRGNPRLVKRFQGFLSYLEGQDDYDELGGEFEPGILLEGPAGVGKTMLAKVLASEAGIPIWSVDAQSLLGTFMGIGPLRVSMMFRSIRNEAIKNGRGAILFMDEIDSIGGRRAGMPPMHWESWNSIPSSLSPGQKQLRYVDKLVELGEIVPAEGEQIKQGMMGGMGMSGGGQILNTILSELDGLTERRTWTWRLRKRLAGFMGYGPDGWLYPKIEVPRVMFIAASNRPDMLDPALTRRGRIGYRIKVDLPSADGLEDIADYYLNGYRHRTTGVLGIRNSADLTAEVIAKSALGRTPADIRFMINSAVQLAHLSNRDEVTVEDWMEAFAEGTLGSKNPLPLSDDERRLLAIHESGHAIVTMAVAQGRIDPVFLTIERYGAAFGHMYPVEVVPRYLGDTEAMIQAGICIFLAGAASEEVIAGHRQNSLGGDIPAVWGRLNILALSGMLGELPIERRDAKLDDAKRLMLKELMKITKRIVEQNRESFSILVPELVARRYLKKDDILALVGDRIVPYEFEKVSD